MRMIEARPISGPPMCGTCLACRDGRDEAASTAKTRRALSPSTACCGIPSISIRLPGKEPSSICAASSEPLRTRPKSGVFQSAACEAQWTAFVGEQDGTRVPLPHPLMGEHLIEARGRRSRQHASAGPEPDESYTTRPPLPSPTGLTRTILTPPVSPSRTRWVSFEPIPRRVRSSIR